MTFNLTPCLTYIVRFCDNITLSMSVSISFQLLDRLCVINIVYSIELTEQVMTLFVKRNIFLKSGQLVVVVFVVINSSKVLPSV